MDEPQPTDDRIPEPTDEFWDVVNETRAGWALGGTSPMRRPVAASPEPSRRPSRHGWGRSLAFMSPTGLAFGGLVAATTGEPVAGVVFGAIFALVATAVVGPDRSPGEPASVTVPATIAAAWTAFGEAADALAASDAPTDARLAAVSARTRLVELFDDFWTATDGFADWTHSEQWHQHPRREQTLRQIAEFIDTCAMTVALVAVDQRRRDVEDASIAEPPVAVDADGNALRDTHGLLAAAANSIEATRAVADGADLPVPALPRPASPTVPSRAEHRSAPQRDDEWSGDPPFCTTCESTMWTDDTTQHALHASNSAATCFTCYCGCGH